jgi:hypothetical protein
MCLLVGHKFDSESFSYDVISNFQLFCRSRNNLWEFIMGSLVTRAIFLVESHIPSLKIPTKIPINQKPLDT